jgi:hypothetical protein
MSLYTVIPPEKWVHSKKLQQEVVADVIGRWEKKGIFLTKPLLEEYRSMGREC